MLMFVASFMSFLGVLSFPCFIEDMKVVFPSLSCCIHIVSYTFQSLFVLHKLGEDSIPCSIWLWILKFIMHYLIDMICGLLLF